MEQTKHTPNDCCGQAAHAETSSRSGNTGEDSKIGTKQTCYQIACDFCGRKSARHWTLRKAVADWNRQTAAPDLLAFAKAYLEYKNDYTKRHPAELWDMALAAIAKAEATS